LYQAVVFAHIIAAIIWIGAMFFLALVLVPVLRSEPRERRAQLMSAVGLRLRSVGWVALAVLLVTGVWNLSNRGFGWDDLSSGDLFEGEFGGILIVKLLLVTVTLAISSVHDFVPGPTSSRAGMSGDVPRMERLRRSASWLARMNLLVALGILWCAVGLVRGLP